MTQAEVLKNYAETETGCWLWQGCTVKGYGMINFEEKRVRAHRFFYEQLVGSIPADKQIHHACRKKSCVNPEHLALVSAREHAQLQKRRRRPDSAIAGGVFISVFDLSQRWNCKTRTAAKRAKNIPKYAFGPTAVRYKVSDVLDFEKRALASGFELRAQELKAEAERQLKRQAQEQESDV
jgi:hypothetical protein